MAQLRGGGRPPWITHHTHHQTFHSSATAHACFLSRETLVAGHVGWTRRRMAAQGAPARAWHRHERMTVAMELATALHHSAQRVEVPREGVEGEQHYAPRRPKPPLQGKRPGLPPEPEPQIRAATVGYVAAPVPLMSAPLLADTAAEAVDVKTVHFLLKDALEQLKERRNMEAEEEERWMAQVKAMTVLSRQIPRKKRKLPRAPLPRCGRPCAVQRQVPAVQVVHVLEGAPASVHRQSVGLPCCATGTWSPQCCAEDRLDPTSPVLGQGRCARVVQRQMRGSMVLQTVEVPQLQSIESRPHPFRAAEGDPMVPVYSADHEGSSIAVRCQVVDAFIAHVVLDMPVVVQRQVLMVQMTSGLSPYSVLSLVRQRITCTVSVYGAFLK